MIRCAPLLFALLATAATAQAGPSLAPLSGLQKSGAQVGALIVRLDNGKILASLNPDTALVPASTSKLYVAAAALERWGADYRFRTRLLATGPARDGMIHGDLVFAGAGDPAFTNETLAKLVRRLAERGIERVSGDLVVNASYFGVLPCVPQSRCRDKSHSSNSYDARLSSAAVNFANAGVSVTPAPHAGSAAEVRQTPYALSMFQLRNRVETVHSGRWAVALSRSTRDGHDVLSARGNAPAGTATRRYYVAVSDPNRYTGELLRACLAAAGIRVDGRVRVETDAPPFGTEVAAVKGQPMWVLLRRMLIWSNNFMADTFALDLLRAHTAPPLSLTAAGAALTETARALEAQSDLMQKREPSVRLASGSGLTTASRVSARDLAALLDAMYRRTGLFPSFLGALTVPAETPVHMLADSGNRVWMRRIVAKTGSLHGRHNVFALAGYLRLPDDGWGAFAVIVNGTQKYEPSLTTSIAATRAVLTPFLKRPRSPAHR